MVCVCVCVGGGGGEGSWWTNNSAIKLTCELVILILGRGNKTDKFPNLQI